MKIREKPKRKHSYYRRPEDYTPKVYNPTDLAYFAGIVDGEGCFWIGLIPENKKGKIVKYHRGILDITNTDKKLIDWIDKTFEGTASARSRKTSSRKYTRDIFSWTSTGDRLLDLCEAILPYLVIKKEHCKLMIKFRKTFVGKVGNTAISEENLAIRQQCLEESRKLNSRWHLHPLKNKS